MKKLLLGLGTLATIVAPIAAVVSCGTGTHTDKKDGEADGNSGGTFIEGTRDRMAPVTELSKTLEEIAPGIIGTTSGKTLEDAEFNGDLIRLTYKVDDSELSEASDESTDLSVVRLTINLKTGVIVKIEYDPGTGAFEDKTDNMIYKDAFDATKVKVAANIAYKAIKALPVSAVNPMTQAIATTKKSITDSSVDQTIKTVALNALENVIDAASYTAYMKSDEYIAFQAAFASSNPGNVGNQGGTVDKIDHNVAITKATTMVDDILDQTKYAMDDTEKTKLVNYLVNTAGDYELSIDAILSGKMNPSKDKGERHGTDDFMVLIKGAPITDYTGEKGFEIGKSASGKDINILKVPTISNPDAKKGLATQVDTQDKILEDAWEETEKEVKNSNFVIYFQSNNNGSVTCQISEIVKFGDDHFEMDTVPEGNVNVDDKFTYKSFIAKQKFGSLEEELTKRGFDYNSLSNKDFATVQGDTIAGIFAGQMEGDATHGTDDYLIALTSGQDRKESTRTAADSKADFKDTNFPDEIFSEISTEDNTGKPGLTAKQSFINRWGENAFNALRNHKVSAILYVQGDATLGKSAASEVELLLTDTINDQIITTVAGPTDGPRYANHIGTIDRIPKS